MVDNIYQIKNSYTIAGNQSAVVGVYFGMRNNQKNPGELYAIDNTGLLYHWIFSPKTSEWVPTKKQLVPCQSSYLSHSKNIFVCGTKEGIVIYDLKTKDKIQEVKAGAVSCVIIGEWIGFVVDKGLIVWDWNSETYILRQSNHPAPVTRVSYNETGTLLATSDSNGTIKLYDTMSSNTITTMHHTSPITGIVFSRPPGSRDSALFASSKDGTVRAYDLIRNKNFRTFVCPDKLTPLESIAVDPSGELVCAAGSEKIYLWNVQTRQLLDVLQAHTAPVTQVAFSAVLSTGRAILGSSSWDQSVRIWDIFGAKGGVEKLTHATEVICFAFRPDGTELSSCTLDGQITIWDVLNNKQTGYIETKRDIVTTTSLGEEGTSLQQSAIKYFTSICYTADGTSIICGGGSQFLCMYSIDQRTLLRRIILSTNASINGVIDLETWYIPLEKRLKKHMKAGKRNRGKVIGEQMIPGSQTEVIPHINVEQVAFSPTNQQFAVALVPEGVMLFNNNNAIEETFQPLDIDPSITPNNIYKELDQENYGSALLMSIRLNERPVIAKVFNHIPAQSMDLVLRSLPSNYLDRFIKFLATELETTTRIEFVLRTVKALLNSHGPYIQQQRIKSSIVSGGVNTHVNLQASLRALIRAFNEKQETLAKIASENKYALEYLRSFKGGKKDILATRTTTEDKEEDLKQVLQKNVFVNK